MKTVFITGAARGIGRATALLFAQRGWNVAFSYIKNTEAALDLEKKKAEELHKYNKFKQRMWCIYHILKFY